MRVSISRFRGLLYPISVLGVISFFITVAHAQDVLSRDFAALQIIPGIPVEQRIQAEVETGSLLASFLSPNGKYFAKTEQISEEEVISYITDAKTGSKLTDAQLGSFVSWSPDSSKVLLFLSDHQNEKGRQIYYLGVNGIYENSDLPSGVISADLSPVDGSIAYVLTEKGTDNSALYLRTEKGRDRVLIREENKVLAWVRWSPDGKKIAYLESDLLFKSGHQYIGFIDTVNNERYDQLSKVAWNFPPVWSRDGERLAFSDRMNIWEYDLYTERLKNLTNFDQGISEHPFYSDDNSLLFSSTSGGDRQVWIVKEAIRPVLNKSLINPVYPVTPSYE